MPLLFVTLLLMGTVGLSSSSAQYGYNPFHDYYFRPHYPQSSHIDYSQEKQISPKFGTRAAAFFGTVTVTAATSWYVVTTTTTTTCTTSSAALSACTPSGGRRRRGLQMRSERRGLFYSDEEEENSFYVPCDSEQKKTRPEEENQPLVRVTRALPTVPFVVEPGHQLPSELVGHNPRFLVAYATAVSATTYTSTYIVSITAVCKSTTCYQICGSTGK